MFPIKPFSPLQLLQESICGKCKVVCTSDDRRNMQVSKEELNIADYTFSRTFDVGNCKISDKFTDLIAGHEGQLFKLCFLDSFSPYFFIYQKL